MKKQLFFLTLMLILSGLATAQNYEWGKSFGGDSDDVVRNMVVDSQGNTYTTGYFAYTATFGTGQNQTEITSNGLSDIFVAKVNGEGDLIWVKNFGGADNDYANSISLDHQGNIYVTGDFQQTVNFNPDNEESILISNGFQDLFVMKLDTNGNFIWVRGFGSANYEESVSVSNDIEGNIYLSGYFFNTMDFDPSVAAYTMTPTSISGNGFIMKMNALGTFEWAKQIGGTDGAGNVYIKVVPNGDLYILGSFTGSCDLDPGTNSYMATSAGKDIYILHLDASGNFINAHTTAVLDASMSTEAWRLDVDASGNIYVIGNFVGSVNFDPLQSAQEEFTLVTESFFYNGFVLKLKASGQAEWVKKVSGSDMILNFDIAVSEQNDIFITGFFTTDAQFGSINISQQSGNYMDAFISKMNADGTFESAYPFGGCGGPDGHEIEMGPENSIYLSSSFHQTVDLDPFESQQFVTAAGVDDYRDIYIIKLSSENLGLIENQANKNVVIYPNPADRFIYLSGNANYATKDFKICDATGRKISQGIVDVQQKIAVEHLAKGIYVLLLDDTVTLKLIKN